MAQINRMTIQGIRSFGPDDEDRQLIQFFSPLTLIQGQNGCGKTTIIESLKYAITGDMPPGCKQGHAFVYDPKLAKETEVRGKVQLKLTDVRGQELVVSRMVQVTQKKTNLNFKTLDASISRKAPDGSRVQTSGRCLDVDAEVCDSVGVTKAIINNVILCHQEETSWPLEEGKKLKERFDAIFDTVRHNKCLKQIDDLRKAMRSDLAIMKSSLDHLKDKKEAAHRLEEEIRDTERRIEIAQGQVDTFEEKCQPLTQRLREIHAQETDAVAIFSAQEGLKSQLTALRKQLKETENCIKTPFVGSIDDLKDAINSFQSEIRDKDRVLRELNGRVESSQKEEERITDEMSRSQKKIGQLESQHQQYERCVQERNKNLGKLCQDCGIQETSVTTESSARDALDLVDRHVTDKIDGVEQLRRELESREQKLQAELDSMRDAKVKQEQEIKMKEEQMQSNNVNSQKIQLEIKEVEKSASRLNDVEKELSSVKVHIDKVAEELNLDETKESINFLEADESRVLQELEMVYKEVQELQLNSEASTRLSMRQKELAEKQSELNRLKNKNADTLKHLLGTIPDTGVKRILNSYMDRLTLEISEKNIELRAAQNEIPKLEANRRHKKEQVDAKEKELKDDEENIFELCQDRDLEDVIKDMDDKIQEMRDQKGMLSSREILYKNYAQKLQESDPCCPLCHRNFDKIEEASTLADELKSEVHSVPTRLRTLNEKLERSVKEYDALLQLKSTYERMTQSKQITIPKFKKELKDIEIQLKNAREKEETVQNEMKIPQENEEMAKRIQNDVTLLDKCQGDVKNMEAEVSKLRADMPATASERSLEEAMKLQNDLRKESEQLRAQVKSAKENLDTHLGKVQTLREKRNQLVEEQLKIQGGTQRLKQMQESLAELQSVDAMLEEEICHLKVDLQMSTQSFEDARRTLVEVRNNNRSQVEQAANQASELKRCFEDVKKLSQNIVDFERRGLATQLQTCQKTLADLARDRTSLRERLKELTGRIDQLKEEISGQEVQKRNLDDNLKLQEKRREETELVAESATLDVRAGTLRYGELLDEKERLVNERERVTRDAQMARGRLEELRKSLVAQRKEVAQEMYRDATAKFSRKLRDITVKEMAESDLAKYYKAMEWAMTQFHQERMKVINSIIHDLWRSIYRGNDIDYIKIEANTPDTADTAKRRSYEYKVVQVKNNAEIEMRTRCSAGQKVLACLIIRIALAETLSSRCGILALDEPTTNLDHDNVESLADALVQIVNTRMINKGFQLLIITHDEDFVQHMRKVTQLSYYHVVSRDEHGKSKIKKHAIQ